MKTANLPILSLLAAAFASIAAGCGTAIPTTAPAAITMPVTQPVITREKAITLAIADCRKGHLVLKGDPTSVDASLMTLKEADAALRSADQTTSYQAPMSTTVWVVSVTGTFELVGGPMGMLNPPPTPVPPQKGVCKAIEEASREQSQGVYTLLQGQ